MTGTAFVRWERIDGFRGRLEYERFERWLGELMAEGRVVQVPVGSPRFADATVLHERWFTGGGSPWRLVEPDPPFAGVFQPRPGRGHHSAPRAVRRAVP